MARPKSEDKRAALLAAATRVIVAQGLSAPTATIAHTAGVSSGSLFTYFATKTELFNQLYLELKAEMAAAVLDGLPAEASLREQLAHLWSNWTAWAVANPAKRRTLAQLGVSDEVTPATRAAANGTIAGIGQVLGRVRAGGPMRDVPMKFVVALMTALAEATVDFMTGDPSRARKHCKAGFDALWRAVA